MILQFCYTFGSTVITKICNIFIKQKKKDETESLCVVEPGPERVHFSKFYKSKHSESLSNIKGEGRTLYDVFQQGARLSNNGKCIGWREKSSKTYVFHSYSETMMRAKNFGSGLISLGHPPGQDTILGVYLKNSPEWIIAELSTFTYSMILVALYDTLGPDSSSHIVNETQMKVVICEDDKNVVNVLNVRSPFLRTVITVNNVTESTASTAKELGVEIYSFKEVEQKGRNNQCDPVPPIPEDLATIYFTSGTTGNPKGVMSTHASETIMQDSMWVAFNNDFIRQDDVMLSYLPLAHMMERSVLHMVFKAGGAVGFFNGDLKYLKDDMVALKPTMMAAVPRVLNKIHEQIMQSIPKSVLFQMIFNLALNAKTTYVKRGIICKDSIWDTLVFNKIRESMGGRLRLFITGAAPAAENVLTFLRCVFGCQVLEGYGQTECQFVSITPYGETKPGNVGYPLPCCKVKLVGVPEMGYFAEQDMGEVCVKGPNLFKGYFNGPDKTKEVLDSDGWVHTGDIGQWLPNGALKIIDRKINMFKLSQGEYISSEKINNIYLRSEFVSQVVIYGESLKSCIVAIVVPKKEVIEEWRTKNNISDSLDFDDTIKRVILEDMQRVGKEAGLASFEQVKDIYLHPELFTIENDLLTPTLKTKRRDIYIKFKKQIDEMYKKFV